MKKILPLLLLLITAGAEQPTTETVTLKTLFQPGKTYLCSQSTNGVMEMKSPLGEGNLKVTSDMQMTYTYTAEEHEKGVKVSMDIDHLTMKSGSEGMNMIEYDSSKEPTEGDPFAAAFQPILDMKCYAIYAEDGTFLEVGGIQDMPGAEQMGMDSEMFKQMFTSSHDLMPKNPVKKGEKWNSELNIPMGKMAPSLKLSLNSTLEGIEEMDGHKVAKISYTADLEKQPLDDAPSAPLSISTKSFKGIYWHDLKENITRKSIATMDLIMGPPAGGTVQENGLGEMPYKIEVTQSLLEIK